MLAFLDSFLAQLFVYANVVGVVGDEPFVEEP